MKEICNRLVLVHDGKIAMVGEPTEVIAKYYEITG